MSENIIFGLDIGTRTVIGVVGYKKADKFVIIAMEIIEQDSRAMIDGQIHNIDEVANTIKIIKERLENKTGLELKEVSIAAAGRSLKTIEVKIENQVDSIMITKKNIRTLEIDGVTLAEEILKKDLSDNDVEYFCVAHTVINYFLDGYVIANLEGHKGKKIGAQVLATFLPKTVIDSLYAVVNRNGLNVETLTLEPIAAINVAIPEKFRLLNLCLLDIGAGTSDIAITKDGSITAYGMIPMAGDEITEKIAHSYLVDFSTAEKIKLEIFKNDEVTFADILGTINTLNKKEILEIIQPVLNELAVQIANKIKELNGGKPPNAVFCVGGGGQVEGFIDILAGEIGLSKDRVALRSSKYIDNIEYKCDKIEGTDMVTPIGICITSICQKGYNFIEVTLNGEVVKLLNARKLKVMDAGIVKEFNHSNLIGRKGKDLKFTLNGKTKKIIGGIGEQAKIFLNNKEADLETPIKEGDNIIISPAQNGEDARLMLSDLLKDNSIYDVTINDESYIVRPIIRVNGEIIETDVEIQSDDIVTIDEIKTVEQVLRQKEMDYANKQIYINNKIVDLNHQIKDGDSIYLEEYFTQTKIDDNIIKKNFTKLNNNVIITLNNERTELDSSKTTHMFVDLLNYVKIDTANKKGRLVMKLNGQPVALTDKIKNGDIAEIQWIDE